MLYRICIPLLLAAALLAPAQAEPQKNDSPRPKQRSETPALDFSLPRVPLADYTAGLEAEGSRHRSRGTMTPSGIDSLDAQRSTLSPYLGLSIKRPLN